MSLESWIYVSRGISELVRIATCLTDNGGLDEYLSDDTHFTDCLDLGNNISLICQEFIINAKEGGAA
jgi:hypothetical protein